MRKIEKIRLILFAILFLLGVVFAIYYCCINNPSAMFANITIILLSFMCIIYEFRCQVDDDIIEGYKELNKTNIENIKELKTLNLKQGELIECLKIKNTIQENIIENLKKQIDDLNN